MPDTHAFRHAACAVAFAAALSATSAAAAPTFADARQMYLGAQYEESLAILRQLHGETPAEQNEISSYQVFCLIALARGDEADRTIETIVSADPFYIPAEDLASPRIRDRFRQTRRKALPAIARREYTTAKLAFDRKDPQSSVMFERVLKLLSDPDLDQAGTADLRVLAEGFRDLSSSLATASTTPTATPAPAAQGRDAATGQAEGSSPPVSAAATTRDDTQQPAASATGAQAPEAPAPGPTDPLTLRPARDGDPGVTPPVAISQPMPRWLPPTPSDRAKEFDGILEVLIDAQGAVTSAAIRTSIHPQYDSQLLQMARSWKFKPALRNGKALPFTKLVEVRLKPAAR
jgi:TonB family protein